MERIWTRTSQFLAIAFPLFLQVFFQKKNNHILSINLPSSPPPIPYMVEPLGLYTIFEWLYHDNQMSEPLMKDRTSDLHVLWIRTVSVYILARLCLVYHMNCVYQASKFLSWFLQLSKVHVLFNTFRTLQMLNIDLEHNKCYTLCWILLNMIQTHMFCS